VDCTSVKHILIQSWRYKTLAVIKRHKKHLSLSFAFVLVVKSSTCSLFRYWESYPVISKRNQRPVEQLAELRQRLESRKTEQGMKGREKKRVDGYTA